MIRFMMFVLLLVVIFLFGVSIGAEQQTKNDSVQVKAVEQHSFERETWILSESSQDTLEEETLFIEKVADSMEKVLSIFFEIVVESLYQVSSIFFSSIYWI